MLSPHSIFCFVPWILTSDVAVTNRFDLKNTTLLGNFVTKFSDTITRKCEMLARRSPNRFFADHNISNLQGMVDSFQQSEHLARFPHTRPSGESC